MDMNYPIARYEIDNTDWFYGAVFSFSLECTEYYNDCVNGAIKFQNTVEMVDYNIDYIGLATDIFYDSIDTQKIYILSETQVYTLDRNLQLYQPPIQLGVVKDQFLCDYMTESYSKQKTLDMILVFC